MYRTCSQHGCIPVVRWNKRKEICITKCRDYDTSAFRWSKGQATEIQIAAENILKTKKRLNEILAANTGKPYDVIAADTERDYYMSAEEAKEYGLIDGVITAR